MLRYFGGIRTGVRDRFAHSRHLSAEPDVGADPGAGAGAGGGGGGAAGAAANGADKGVLKQEDVNRIIAAERRAWEKKLEQETAARTGAEGRLGTVEAELAEIKKVIKAATDADDAAALAGTRGGTGDPALDDFERSLEIPAGIKDPAAYRALNRALFLQTRKQSEVARQADALGTTVKALQGELETERAHRKTAEQAARAAQIDQALLTALGKNKCIDPEVGLRILRDQVRLEKGRPVFVRKDGQEVSVLDGVTAELPDYMRQPAADQGGSGGAGSRTVVTDQQLTQLETQLLAAQEQVRKTGGSTQAVSQYQEVKRRIAAAKKDRG